MIPEEDELLMFIVNTTGVPGETVNRVVRLGEPWPFVRAFDQFLKTSGADAASLTVPEETALWANAELLDLGVEGLDPASLDHHLEQVTDLSGEEPEIVESIGKALHAFFRAKLTRLQHVVNQQRSAKI